MTTNDHFTINYGFRPVCVAVDVCNFPRQLHENKRLVAINTRQHWIQCITFAGETNAVCSRGLADRHTQTLSITIPSPAAAKGQKSARDSFIIHQ